MKMVQKMTFSKTTILHISLKKKEKHQLLLKAQLHLKKNKKSRGKKLLEHQESQKVILSKLCIVFTWDIRF